MFNYDPATSPFELPVQKLIAYCITERPLFLPPRQGSTPGTSLAGTFGIALWSTVCFYSNTPAGACNTLQGKPRCQAPSTCILPWLYKPYSEVHRRNFARPVLLRSADLEGAAPVDVFTLEVTLWGRHAIAAQEAVKNTLVKMGELGLNSEGTPVRFKVNNIESEQAFTLSQRLERLPKVQSVLLEFQTPFLHGEKTSEGKRQFYIREQLPIVSLLGSVAYNLAAWDMEDRDLGKKLDGKARHDLARDTRDIAWKVAEELFIVRTHLSPVEVGERFSRGNRKTMQIQGFVGLAELAGNVGVAMPWLLTLALAGGGQKRAMGFGSVRMWFDGSSL